MVYWCVRFTQADKIHFLSILTQQILLYFKTQRKKNAWEKSLSFLVRLSSLCFFPLKFSARFTFRKGWESSVIKMASVVGWLVSYRNGCCCQFTFFFRCGCCCCCLFSSQFYFSHAFYVIFIFQLTHMHVYGLRVCVCECVNRVENTHFEVQQASCW